MASCGSDGCVRVWDVRQEDQPVASFEPQKGSQVSAVPLSPCHELWIHIMCQLTSTKSSV